jgi:hypothetical protein
MRKKMGRPRLSKKGVAVVFSVRLPPDEARVITNAIFNSGHKRPDWLREALLAAAQKK